MRTTFLSLAALSLTAAACDEPLRPELGVPGGPVSGFRVVVSESRRGQGVEQVHIRLTPAGGAADSLRRQVDALTSVRGEAVFPDLAPGAYHMLVRRIGYDAIRRTIDLNGGGAATVGIVLVESYQPRCYQRIIPDRELRPR